jgi:hypothetical protein
VACVISLGRLASELAAVPGLTPADFVEVLGSECREALGGERLTPRALAEAAGVLRMGLAGLGVAGGEADRLADRLRELLVA